MSKPSVNIAALPGRTRQPIEPIAGNVALVVLGMHRSGTSAVTRVLSLSGYALPKTLMPAAADNEEGFWESQPIARFNEELLAEIGSGWDDPFAFSASRSPVGALKAHMARAVELIRSEFPESRSLVLKDPRITMLYDFWVQALREAGYEPAPVICVRNPLEVAASLTRRNGFPVNKSLLVWLSYQLAAERATRDAPRSFVMFEDMFSDWRGCLDRIEQSLGVPLERRDPQAELLIERALRPDLRHHRAGDDQLAASANYPPWIGEAWSWFSAAARMANPDPSQLGPVVAEYARHRRWFAPLVADLTLRLQETNASAESAAKAADQRFLDATSTYENVIQGQRAEIANERANVVHLLGDIERDKALHEAQIAQLEAARDAAQASFEERTRQLADRARIHEADYEHLMAEIWKLHDIKGQLEHQRDMMTLARDNAEKQAAGWAEEAERLDKERIQLSAAASRVSDVEALREQTIRGYEAERERREREIDVERAKGLQVIRELEADLRKLKHHSDEQGRKYDQLTRDHAAVVSSTMWRATRPMRAIARRAPWLFGGARAILRPIARILTGRAFRPKPVVAEAPAPTAKEPPKVWSGFDPEPIASYLTAELYSHAEIEGWREHCRSFPLPIDPKSSAKPNLTMTDERADEWIQRCRVLGEKLVPVIGKPDISIVVPVHNQLAFTLSAIASVYGQATKHSYEILVGDDASSDQTKRLGEAGLPRVKVIHHATNQGFIGNCNATAALASGRIVVFLNNDVVVLPGWLDELVGPLESGSGVGLVGSKLLYADAMLQEAGGIVWRDGSAWNFGRGQDPREPKYCYAREVDYCSGASIAITADLWRRLNGFDGRHYEVAYYEDTDLAFRVRMAGFKVLYQPLSVLVHFEGVSSGVDLTQGAKQHQVTNAKRFFERWRDTLAKHRENAVEPYFECERNIRNRILIIDTVTPTPDRDAGSLAMFDMISILNGLGWRTSFVPEDNFAHLPECRSLQRIGVETIHWPHYQSVGEVLEKRGHEFDVILMSRARTVEKHWETVRRDAPHARVIFHVADLHFVREMREAELSKVPTAIANAQRLRAIELGAVAGADVTMVHSSAERDILAKELPGGRVSVFPWIADVRPPQVDPAARRHVVFVGGFRHAPNVDGVRWFLKEIWPLVRAKAPNASFRCVGADAPKEFEAYTNRDGVVMTGWLPDLDAELAKARVTVAPLRYGAGIKGKVISSMQVGVPVVGTSIAAEGMGLRAGEDILVEDDPAAFADAIVRLLSDGEAWERLSRNGMQFVEDNYSRALARKRLADILLKLGYVTD